ncbi:MAG: RIP metalloprotease RseP [Gemmataceae bacterium]|nr:RIP metalloprotease RseP [Gemmataceae bacterium]
MDKSEPVAPTAASETPQSIGGWFAANIMPIAFVGAVIALIIWRGLVIWDVAIAVFGLGMVIFIHELGHFLAAKFCDVHVETFSIGFGKAIPGCQFRKGETLYKIGWIPLGGYVKMVGEGDNADTEEAYEDPRSFKNKPVWQRMAIISAGVVMNLILGCLCFMVAYTHGVEETPAIVGSIGVGSAAWEEDLRAGDHIVQIDDIKKPTFDDIRPEVMSKGLGGSIPFYINRRGELVSRRANLVPRRNPDELYPLVGINPIDQLTLQKSRRPGTQAVRKDSVAAKARAADASELKGGDRIIASSHDPKNPADVKPIPSDAGENKLDTLEFMRRQHQMRGKPMTIHVDRDGATMVFVIEPAYTTVLPGVRFTMGRLAAMRSTGPAAKAVLVSPAGENGLQMAKLDQADSGDRIIAIEIKRDGKTVRFVDEFSKERKDDAAEELFDPLRLGYDLETWAETATDLTLKITVLRSATGETKTSTRVTFALKWDPNLVNNGESILSANAPMPISGLGLAYYVDTTINSAESGSALKKGDAITEVRFRDVNDKGEVKPEDWMPLKHHQGTYLHTLLQRMPQTEINLKVQRAGGEEEIAITPVADPAKKWSAVDRGFYFISDTRLQKADGLVDAVGMGLHRTWRTVRVIYQTLYATIFRQISAKTMSGPLSIANASYKIAGYDLWQFIIFIGLININLAVVNFLPIPLLDGGHMVFLIYEKIRGKPAPEKLQEYALYVGLAFILLLMVFVIFLDVRKLFF